MCFINSTFLRSTSAKIIKNVPIRQYVNFPLSIELTNFAADLKCGQTENSNLGLSATADKQRIQIWSHPQLRASRDFKFETVRSCGQTEISNLELSALADRQKSQIWNHPQLRTDREFKFGTIRSCGQLENSNLELSAQKDEKSEIHYTY